jgi:nitroreductase
MVLGLGREAMEMNLEKEKYIQLILKRRSVRAFTGESVSRAELETILRAGMAAPSAMNKQPWEFVAVADRSTLDTLSDGLPYAKMLYQAGAAIVVCAVVEKANDNLLEYAIVDTCAATENILLAVEALGLGAVWTALYPRRERMEYARKVLQIPDSIIPLCAIPIGHPAGKEQPKDKYRPENIHWEKW